MLIGALSLIAIAVVSGTTCFNEPYRLAYFGK
jgi:hypothetical protein